MSDVVRSETAGAASTLRILVYAALIVAAVWFLLPMFVMIITSRIRIVPADITEYRLEANDIYLLCSDGLTDMVDPEVVHSVVDEKIPDLAEAAAELVDLANQNGGRDNISVVLVRVPPDFLPASGWAQRFLAKKKNK